MKRTVNNHKPPQIPQLQLAGFKKNKKSQKSWVFHIESGFGGICFDFILVEA